jgi:hypothetical protein
MPAWVRDPAMNRYQRAIERGVTVGHGSPVDRHVPGFETFAVPGPQDTPRASAAARERARLVRPSAAARLRVQGDVAGGS